MTIAKAKTILRKDMRCKTLKRCKGSCVDCKDYVTEEQIAEAEKFVINWINARQEHEKLKRLYG